MLRYKEIVWLLFLSLLTNMMLICCGCSRSKSMLTEENRIIELMANTEKLCVSNANISTVIYEEMPAYFENQKSLEEVIGIINNRAQLVLDEKSSNQLSCGCIKGYVQNLLGDNVGF